jgi:RNA polymerase sigma-70 factor, ECF subfamily
MMISVGSKTVDEQELVTRSRQGDRDAFGDLVRIYQDRLFNSLARIVASRVDAEDLVQEAFVQAYLKLASFRGNCSFYTWLYRIALNLAYSNARRRQVRKALERTREVSEDIPADSTMSPSERIERAEESARIRRALSALSQEHRALLVLRGVEGFDYQTIAEVLHLNPGTVRSRLHRARAHFREKLDREDCLVG